jgi:hypothetical protein
MAENARLLKKTAELEHRYLAGVSRLREYDAMRKADRDAGRAIEQNERLAQLRKPHLPLESVGQPPAVGGKENGMIGPKGQARHTPALIPHWTEYFDDRGLLLTRKERSILNRLTHGLLSTAERQKLERAFDQSRYLQALQQKRVEAKRARREAEMKKTRAKRGKVQISQPSRGSSLFGGVKYSHICVFQGGLPGLGKSR